LPVAIEQSLLRRFGQPIQGFVDDAAFPDVSGEGVVGAVDDDFLQKPLRRKGALLSKIRLFWTAVAGP
jgi:hypothetical protein